MHCSNARLFIPSILMRLCSDLSPANDSEITLPLESYTSATEQPPHPNQHDFFFFYFIPHVSLPADTMKSWEGVMKWIVTILSCKWSWLWLCKCRSWDNETQLKARIGVIMKRHQQIFNFVRVVWIRHNRKGHVAITILKHDINLSLRKLNSSWKPLNFIFILSVEPKNYF